MSFRPKVLMIRRVVFQSKRNSRCFSSARNQVLQVHDDIANGVVTLTLNRPQQRNALSCDLLDALKKELQRIKEDECESFRAVVLQANGPAFCAGHDLREMSLANQASVADLFSLCSEVMTQIEELPQPVIGAIHGIATAAGCQLAAACDMVLASEKSRFATPGVSIGLFCSTPAVPLVRSVGKKAAMDMLLTGRLVKANEALQMGLVSRIVHLEKDIDEHIQVQNAAHELALQVAACSGPALRIGKSTFRTQTEMPLREAYAVASKAMATNMNTLDAKEGIQAFLSKRRPEWSHK